MVTVSRARGERLFCELGDADRRNEPSAVWRLVSDRKLRGGYRIMSEAEPPLCLALGNRYELIGTAYYRVILQKYTGSATQLWTLVAIDAVEPCYVVRSGTFSRSGGATYRMALCAEGGSAAAETAIACLEYAVKSAEEAALRTRGFCHWSFAER